MKINSTQRILSLALAFLVLMNGLGIFVFNYAEIEFHRVFNKVSESEKNTQTFALNSAEFSSILWIGERDFVYNGNVYDCDKIASVNGRINVSCHSDNEETNLKNSLASNFDNGNKNVPASKPLKDLFKIFPVFQNLAETDHLISRENSSFDFSQFNSLLPQSVDLSLVSPPPEMA
ncbi:MAG TPA: hypothetical protein VFJ43_06285 [Bacteroidia bacterium]|nr:hypothetical protein [Bacteroidia bacterium]